jgi:hypothetical protein
MENVKINELCTCCKCTRENCKSIEEYAQGTCRIYKCLNYEMDLNKVNPYKQFKYCIRSDNDKIQHKKLYS